MGQGAVKLAGLLAMLAMPFSTRRTMKQVKPLPSEPVHMRELSEQEKTVRAVIKLREGRRRWFPKHQQKTTKIKRVRREVRANQI